MPALTDLETRIAPSPLDSQWQDMYSNNLERAKEIADKIALIHLVGGQNRFLDIVSKPPHELLVSDKSDGRCSPQTTQTEDILGLGRCLYFYAGRTFPQVGDIALAFDSTSELDAVSATPFDTGNLVWGDIKSSLPAGNRGALKEFVEKSISEFSPWREKFAVYLAAYFREPSHYWSGQPCKTDPEGMFNKENDFLAWVVEVRFANRLSIKSRIAWCATEPLTESLRRLAIDEGAAGSPMLVEFLAGSGQVGAPEGSSQVGRVMEQWQREELGL